MSIDKETALEEVTQDWEQTESGEVLAASFNSFSKKSVLSIIIMGKVVLASNRLSPEELDKFYSGIRYNKESKTLSKFKKIGETSKLLSQYLDFLPSSWTTIYKLCDLSDHNFAEFSADGSLHPFMSGEDAEKLICRSKGKNWGGGSKGKQPQSATLGSVQWADDSYSIAVQFKVEPTPAVIQEMKGYLAEFETRFNCVIDKTKLLTILWDQPEAIAA